ncbi:M2 family metallopeptidase [Myxococcota bacterium]|nr:M2 family metallopeptidase [Myxococcota bacterium]MBU1536256.1 M2 family metallopeptidase [Myxococcota bacterium]
MRTMITLLTVTLSLALATNSCKKKEQKSGNEPVKKHPKVVAMKKATTPPTQKKPAVDWQKQADSFLAKYNSEYAKLEKRETVSFWQASLTGKKEDYAANGVAKLDLKKFHSDPGKYKTIEKLLTHEKALKPLTIRSLHVALNAFKENQLSNEMLKKIIDLEKDIEQNFQSFRALYKKKKVTNNVLLDNLKKSTVSKERQEAWDALKAVGAVVGPKLVSLATVRNEAAKKLGFKNYWTMKVKLQDHNPETLVALFAELDTLTRAPFKKMKDTMDKELAAKFGCKPQELKPWHYDNPFFQEAPPQKALDLDVFFKGMKKEDIVAISTRFFKAMGLPMEDIAARSDYYERSGKDQNAFCTSIDRSGDVRTLLNIKPTAKWMDTMLHESGHAVYDKWIARKLPYNLREAGHIFTTEGVAMLFGALVKNPAWLVAFAKADPRKVEKAKGLIAQQRKREQLIFTRWTLVMLNFEKALYENPGQDLNKLWWDMVEKYQMLSRPKGRNLPDWASKPHFTIAPVYYHNYMMGELFAAQMRATMAKMVGYTGPASELVIWNNPKVTTWLKNLVFKPGMRSQWETMVKNATGTNLSAKAFSEEIK